MYCYYRCLASLYGSGSWPQLLFWLVNFYLFNLCSLMANNEGQYNPRAQAMEEVHFDWKCTVCSMVALSPFIWNSNTSLGLNLFILIWTIPLGLNVTSATPLFIYSVGPGNQFMLLDPDVFFAPSPVVDSSNLSSPLLISIYSFPCHGRWHGRENALMTRNPKSQKETVEGVPTTNSQSETSRQKQCKSVSKKSGGLNLSLYHLERNIHPETRLWPALGSVRAQYQSA